MRYLLFLVTLCAQLAFAKEPVKICYVSSNVTRILPRANDAADQHGGFLLAIEEQNQRSQQQFAFKVFEPSESPLSVVSGIENAYREKCVAVVGLVSSRDACLAAPFLRKFNMVGFSSTATSNELDKFFPHAMSASTSVHWATEAIRAAVAKFRFDHTFLIVRENDFYSDQYRETLKDIKGIQLIKVDSVTFKLPRDCLREIQGKKGRLGVIYTTYPFASTPSLKQLSDLPNITVIGTPAWMEMQAFQFIKKRQVLIPAAWEGEQGNARAVEFSNKYLKRFGKVSDHDSYYDYDVCSIIIQQYLSAESLAESLKKPFEFAGVTGLFSFDGKHSHPKRNDRLIKLMIGQ